VGMAHPFLLSLLMVAIASTSDSSSRRRDLQAIKAKGQTSTNPWREAFWSQNTDTC